MIFKQIDEILSGKKTQTRRIVKPDERQYWQYADTRWTQPLKGGEPASGVSLISNDRVKWAVGRTYAIVPKRGMKAISDGRIRICSIHCESLQWITEVDARAEGVESVAAYRDLWQSINGKTKGARWEDSPMVWVITFEAVRS